MNNFEFLFLNTFIFLVGRSFFIFLFKTTDNKNYFSTAQFIFYPAFGVILISFSIFISNLFFPLKDIKTYLITFFVILALFNLRHIKKVRLNKFLIFNYVFTPLILSISSYNIKFHYDAEAYHLATQSWVINEKLTFGLSKYYIWLGHSSLFDYLQSIFSFQGNYIYQHYLNLAFFNLIINFLCFHLINIKSKFFFNASFFIILYGILDNFGVGGGSNGFLEIQMVGKPDIVFGVTYFLISIFLIYGIYEQESNTKEIKFLLILLVFLVQIRVTGLSVVILLIPYVIKNIKHIKSTMKSLFFLNIVVYNLLWIFKNIAVSSCLFFPLEYSCLNFLPWSIKENMSLLSEGYTQWGLSYKFDSNIFIFFKDWFNLGYNYQQVPNLIISLFLLILIKKVLFVRTKKKSNFLYIYIFLIFVLNLYFTFHIRYMFGLILLVVVLISNNGQLNDRFRFLRNRYVIYSLFLILTVGIPRGYSYNYMFNEPNYYKLPIDYSEFRYKDNEKGIGVNSRNNKCYDILLCSTHFTNTNTSIYLEEYFWNYKIFISNDA